MGDATRKWGLLKEGSTGAKKWTPTQGGTPTMQLVARKGGRSRTKEGTQPQEHLGFWYL